MTFRTSNHCLLIFKRRLLEAFAVCAAAGEVYLAAVEAVLVFDIAVFADWRVLLVPAAVKVTTFISMEVAAILAKAIFTTFIKATTFVPFVSPTVLVFLFFRA